MKLTDRNIRLILSNYDIGAGKKGAAAGPEALKSELISLGIQFKDTIVLNTNGGVPDSVLHPFCKHIELVTEAAEKLNKAVVEAIENKQFPLIFSGDHSNAIGGLSGLVNANPGKRIGVIWIDAHADLHSPYTTPSGNMHGMPLAVLTAQDNAANAKNAVTEEEKKAWDKLKMLGGQGPGQKVKPEDLIFISIRDAEKEEWDLIDSCNILTFEPDEIKEHGIYRALNRSIEHLSSCDLFYVSFDVDSMDPDISEGTGTPVEGGLKLAEAEAVFKTFLNHPKTAAFEITEINPGLDKGSKRMAPVVAGLFAYALKA
jgi:arginase